MARLKLGTIVDDRPVKLTVELPANVHRDLLAYAEVLAHETGQKVTEPSKLIAPSLAFYGDRSQKSVRQLMRDRPGADNARLAISGDFPVSDCHCPEVNGATRLLRMSRAASQRCPRRQRIHVVAPAHDLAVLNKSDRDKPIIVDGAGLEYLAVNLVFEGHNVTIRGRMRGQRIAALEEDAVAVPGIERHEVCATSYRLRPTRH